MTFAYFLRRAARYWGDNPAVLYRDRVLTYRRSTSVPRGWRTRCWRWA
jgi:hypothetical protein